MVLGFCSVYPPQKDGWFLLLFSFIPPPPKKKAKEENGRFLVLLTFIPPPPKKKKKKKEKHICSVSSPQSTYPIFGAFCLNVRTLAFCQLMGFPY